MGHGLLRQVMHCGGRTQTVSVAQNLYFAKRGSLPVGDRFIEDALLKHHITLTEHVEYDVPDDFRDAVRSVVNEVYASGNRINCFPKVVGGSTRSLLKALPFFGVEFDDEDEPVWPIGNRCSCSPTCACEQGDCYCRPVRGFERPIGWGQVPSFGSCVENPRSKGGTFGQLVDHEGIGSFFGLFPKEGYLIGYLRCRTLVTELRVPDVWWEEEFCEIRRRARCVDVIQCIPVALCEPFKVRVITRGSAEPYHIARAYQSILHKGMSRNDPFLLTKGPVVPDVVDRMLEKARSMPNSHDGFWVSGDYEAATDNLHPDLSEECMEAICQKLHICPEDRLLLLKALTGHEIAWVGTGSGRTSARQVWGQLMGSPVSFPILCLVNAAITKLWYEEMLGRKVRLIDLPLLVNGDDILFWCPSVDAYTRWKELTTEAGLMPSLGKNYCSDKYLVINSEITRIKRTVDWFGCPTWVRLERLQKINFGLFYGSGKSQSSHELEKKIFGGGDRSSSGLGLRQRAIDWVDGYPYDRDLMMTSFLIQWKEFLHAVPIEMSWWIHPSYGGLGLPVTRRVEITERQRKMAAYLHVTGDVMKGLSQPVPMFTEVCLRTFSAALKKVKQEVVRGGQYDCSSWHLLPYFIRMGYDPSDPPGYGAFLKSFNKYWKKSKTFWAKPLSFRKCIAGPEQRMGGAYPINLE
jgi:hypothetical protein